MSGSAWYFERFLYLAVKVLDSQFKISTWNGSKKLKMAEYINFEAEAEHIEQDEVSNLSDNE